MAKTPTSSPRELALAMAQRDGIALSDTMLATLDALADSREEAATETSTTPEPLPASALTLAAALRATFSVDELGQHPNAELLALLAHTETVIVSGNRRLQLTPRARGAVLAKAAGTPLYRKMFDAAVAYDQEHFDDISTDPIRCATAWLRCFLSGEWGDLERAPVNELRAAREALLQLSNVELPFKLPTPENITRLLDRAQWIEPMMLLVGASGGWDGTRAIDRFAGREEELKVLRAFVDALASQSYSETIARGVGRLTNLLSQVVFNADGPSRLTIEAAGGLGKSTLLAKFILDHARNPGDSIPTVFLDFDRATLHSADPRQLLLESIRQLRTQFQAVDQPLALLEQRVRRAMVTKDSTTVDVSGWGEWLDDLANVHQSASHQPLLLVLDTLEVVQSVPHVLESAVQFLDAMTSKEGRSKVRVVLSGRTDVPQLSRPPNAPAPHCIKLKALSLDDAKKMVEKLGRSFLGEGWRSTWNARLAGPSSADERRREPLTLRIAVELIRAEQSAENRESLSRDIEQMSSDVAGGFVGPLYRRRILAHIRDPEVRKLAWPGLVLRRITPTIADELLVPLCNLDRSRLDETLAALRRERWIVTPDDEGGLRHEPELRRRTLPLMRRQPEFAPDVTFESVNRAAINYFATRNGEQSSRAEWIYHRLLADEPIEAIDRDWTPQVAVFLADAAEDFPEGSEARHYLYARAQRTPLTAGKIRRLQAKYAFEHLARTMPDLCFLDDERLSTVISALDFREPADWSIRHAHSDRLSAVVYTLAVKTGRWNWHYDEPNSASLWASPAICARLFAAARSRRGAALVRVPPIRDVLEERGRRFSVSLMALVDQIAARQLYGVGEPIGVEGVLDRALVGRRDRSDEVKNAAFLSACRLLTLFGERSSWAGWCAYHRARTQRARRQGFSVEEVLTLKGMAERIPSVNSKLRRSLEDDKVTQRSRGRRDGVTRDPDLVRTLLSCWEALTERSLWPQVERDARYFASLRHEDWIVPLAYAASRSFPKGVPREVRNELSHASLREIEFGRRGDQQFLDLFAAADDAGGLPDAVAALARGLPAYEDFSQRAGDFKDYISRTKKIQD